MGIPLRAKANGFHYTHGESRQGASNAQVVEKSPEVPVQSLKGNLYLFVDLVNQQHGQEQVLSQLLHIIRKSFFATHGTITASLKRALEEANRYLLQLNLNAPYERKIDGAACVVALRGNDAFIARVGPCAVYHLRSTRWKRFPPYEPQAGPAAGPVPLGLRQELEVAFHHTDIAPGDQLILVDSRGDQALIASPAVGAAEAAAEYALNAAGSQTDFSGLMIELSPVGPAHEPPRQPVAKVSPVESVSEPETFPSQRTALFSRRKTDEGTRQEPEPTPLMPAHDALVPTEDVKPEERRREASISGPAAAKPKRYSRTAALLALLAPFLVIGAVLGYNWYQGQQAEKAFRQQLAQAQDYYGTARFTSDRTVARSSLDAAQSFLRGALEIFPNDQTALRLREDIIALDYKIRMVTPLYYVAELYSYTEAGSDPARIVINGREIFVLDRANSRVTLHLLNEVGDALQRGQEMIEIIRKGQQVGNMVVGNLVDMAWMPAGGDWRQDSLLILDASGNIIVYTKAGLSSHALAAAGTLQSPIIIDSFTGARLYILDSTTDQIYRFTPSSSGYTVAPDAYFADDVRVDLHSARDLAIDGDVWVLFPDTIGRYQGGRPIAFDITGLEEPFSSPISLFTAPTAGALPTRHLYVTDPGNARIVKLSKEGAFIRQFRSAEERHFDRLKDLFVNEATGRAYFLAGNGLYMAILPEGE